MTDAGSFHGFEHRGWSSESVAAGYHENFAELTTQATGPLLDAAGVGPWMRVLDFLPVRRSGPVQAQPRGGRLPVGDGHEAASRLARGVARRDVRGARERRVVRAATLLRAQTPEALTSIRNPIREAVSANFRDGAIELTMPALVAVGRKPLYCGAFPRFR